MRSARILRHSRSRKAEQQIGRAGNGDRSPERKGVASKSRHLRNDPRPKIPSLGLPDSRRSEAPRGVYEGTESFAGDACYRKPGYSHLAQPAEPPYADPHVRWCGRGGRVIVPPIPIACDLANVEDGNGGLAIEELGFAPATLVVQGHPAPLLHPIV